MKILLGFILLAISVVGCSVKDTPMQVVCTSGVDGSILRSKVASAWQPYSERVGYYGWQNFSGVKLTFSPRTGDTCEILEVTR
jgi:hypothetical protein